jgi:hypothetical protein
MTSKKYAVKVRAEGRGRASTFRFGSLHDAAYYIKSHWQGADYVDGNDGFHTDYSTFDLIGFNLTDVGRFTITEDGCREFSFHSLDGQIGHAEMSREDMVRAGLIEGPNYRDFPGGNEWQ